MTTDAKQTDGTADALVAALFSHSVADGNEGKNIVDALFAIARAIEKLTFHVKYLGGGDNADSRGAVEFLAIKVDEGANRIADAGDAIAGAIEGLAEKVEGASESIGRRITDASEFIEHAIKDEDGRS
jgi:hypothetical protein